MTIIAVLWVRVRISIYINIVDTTNYHYNFKFQLIPSYFQMEPT